MDGTESKPHEKSTLPNYIWLKLPIKLLADIDFMTLTDQAVSLFVKLYLMALRADAEGLVANERRLYTVKDIAWQLRKSEDETQKAIDELKAAGFIDDNEELRIAHFLDEQGPGDNAQRTLWRERQRARRAKLKNNPDEELTEKRKEEAESSVEVEESRQYTGRHEDVTVTPEPPPAASSSSKSKDEILLHVWKELTGTKAKGQHLPNIRGIWELNSDSSLVRNRLILCGKFWKRTATDNGWSINNPDVILELFEPGALETRMEREGITFEDLR